MSSRFNNLEDVYNTLLAANFDFNQLPATNKYRKYKEWKQDPELRKLPATSETDSGKRVKAGLAAFGLHDGGGSDDLALIKIGTRVRTYHDNLGAGNSVFDLTTSAIPTTYIYRGGFKPAKAVLGKLGATVTPISKITGREYKTSISDSYTIPFGSSGTGAGSTEIGKQDIILASSLTDTHVITFIPEKMVRR